MRDQVIKRCLSIPGWMSEKELGWLYDRAQEHKTIVEVGTYQGRSTFALGSSTPGVVFTVDHYCGSPAEMTTSFADLASTDGRKKAMLTALSNLWDLIDGGAVVPLLMHSASAARMLSDIGMCFVDGAHDRDSVETDIASWWPRMRPGGLFCGHDKDHPDVRLAIRSWFSVFEAGAGSIWWVQK